MFEYSIIPFSFVPDAHIGFWLVVAMCIVIFSIIGHHIKEVSIGILCILAYTGYKSFSTDASTDCAKYQERVVAEFVGFAPEVYKERQGKRDVVQHKVYAQYRYGVDNIITELNSNSAPKFAYFYRINRNLYPRCVKSH